MLARNVGNSLVNSKLMLFFLCLSVGLAQRGLWAEPPGTTSGQVEEALPITPVVQKLATGKPADNTQPERAVVAADPANPDSVNTTVQVDAPATTAKPSSKVVMSEEIGKAVSAVQAFNKAIADKDAAINQEKNARSELAQARQRLNEENKQVKTLEQQAAVIKKVADNTNQRAIATEKIQTEAQTSFKKAQEAEQAYINSVKGLGDTPNIKGQKEKLNQATITAQQGLTAAMDAKEQADKDALTANEQLENLQTKLEAAKLRVGNVSGEVKEAEELLKNNSAALQEISNSLADLKKTREEAQQQAIITAKNAAQKNLAAAQESAKSAMAKMKSEIYTLTAQMKAADQEIRANNENISNLRNVVADLATKTAEEAKKFSDDVRQNKTTKDNPPKSLTDLKQKVATVQQQLTKAYGESSRLDANAKKIRQDLKLQTEALGQASVTAAQNEAVLRAKISNVEKNTKDAISQVLIPLPPVITKTSAPQPEVFAEKTASSEMGTSTPNSPADVRAADADSETSETKDTPESKTVSTMLGDTSSQLNEDASSGGKIFNPALPPSDAVVSSFENNPEAAAKFLESATKTAKGRAFGQEKFDNIKKAFKGLSSGAQLEVLKKASDPNQGIGDGDTGQVLKGIVYALGAGGLTKQEDLDQKTLYAEKDSYRATLKMHVLGREAVANAFEEQKTAINKNAALSFEEKRQQLTDLDKEKAAAIKAATKKANHAAFMRSQTGRTATKVCGAMAAASLALLPFAPLVPLLAIPAVLALPATMMTNLSNSFDWHKKLATGKIVNTLKDSVQNTVIMHRDVLAKIKSRTDHPTPTLLESFFLKRGINPGAPDADATNLSKFYLQDEKFVTTTSSELFTNFKAKKDIVNALDNGGPFKQFLNQADTLSPEKRTRALQSFAGMIINLGSAQDDASQKQYTALRDAVVKDNGDIFSGDHFAAVSSALLITECNKRGLQMPEDLEFTAGSVLGNKDYIRKALSDLANSETDTDRANDMLNTIKARTTPLVTTGKIGNFISGLFNKISNAVAKFLGAEATKQEDVAFKLAKVQKMAGEKRKKIGGSNVGDKVAESQPQNPEQKITLNQNNGALVPFKPGQLVPTPDNKELQVASIHEDDVILKNVSFGQPKLLSDIPSNAQQADEPKKLTPETGALIPYVPLNAQTGALVVYQPKELVPVPSNDVLLEESSKPQSLQENEGSGAKVPVGLKMPQNRLTQEMKRRALATNAANAANLDTITRSEELPEEKPVAILDNLPAVASARKTSIADAVSMLPSSRDIAKIGQHVNIAEGSVLKATMRTAPLVAQRSGLLMRSEGPSKTKTTLKKSDFTSTLTRSVPAFKGK